MHASLGSFFLPLIAFFGASIFSYWTTKLFPSWPRELILNIILLAVVLDTTLCKGFLKIRFETVGSDITGAISIGYSWTDWSDWKTNCGCAGGSGWKAR